MPQPFLNPWQISHDDNVAGINVQFRTSRAEYQRLKSILTNHGDLNILHNLLLKALLHECSRRGWTKSTDARQVKDFAANLVLCEVKEVDLLNYNKITYGKI